MIRFSLLRALAVGVCVLLGFPIFPEHPAWAALTVVLVVRPPARRIVVTGASRAIGTLAGGAPGVADVVVSGGSTVGLLAGFIGAASVLVATMSVNSTVFPCFLTALIVLSKGLAREAALTVGWDRLLATLLGVGSAFLVIVVWLLIADRRDPVPQGPG